MSEFPDDVKMVADGIAADIPSTVRKGNRPFISNVIARAIMADRAALSSAAVAEREPVAWRSSHGGYYHGNRKPNVDPDAITLEPLYLDPLPTSELEAENARLRDRVAELDKALEPFANLANSYDGIPPRKYFGDTDGELRYYDEHKTLVEIGYLRAARRVREGGKVDG